MVRAVVCGEAELQTSQCRAYLAVVIIWLAGQDAQQAYHCHQVPLFVSISLHLNLRVDELKLLSSGVAITQPGCMQC